jgi:hypothetical protein
MIIIGIITIGLIISRYPTSTGRYTYTYGNNVNGSTLGATAYNADYSGAPTNSFLNFGSRQPYQAVVNRSYYPDYYYPTTYTQPSTKSYYYYYSNPGTSTTTTSYTDGYYYGDVQGYVPPGCEGGTDYSTITNEPCG